MKKVLSLFAGVALSATMFAQLTPGSTAPDWTFTDLNGNSWNLYTLTAQGKTVFIDVSATWCGPCWSYHNTHALRDIYDEYGPTGTIDPDEIMVFYIEGDAATTVADLNGTGSNTQGDWVTGTTYPIIDPGAATNQFNNDYGIGYFPTIYKVCPDNKIYEVGQLNAQGLLNTIGSCPAVGADAYATGGPSSLNCVSTFAPEVTLKNNSLTVTLTSCDISYAYDGGGATVMNWTGSLAPGATTQVTLPSQTFTAGAHTVDVIVSNPNSGVDDNVFNDGAQTYGFSVNSAAATATPYTNNMSSASFPYSNWLVTNPDGTITWERGTTNGGSLWMDCYSYPTAGETDDFIMEPMDFSSLATASVQFNVAHARYSASYTDALAVLVSTDCGVTWTSVWSKSGTTLATAPNTTSAFVPTASQWRAECINLNAYAGQSKVFVMFRCTNGYGNNIYVDDINVSSTVCPTGINDQVENTNNMQLYPNPANTLANVSFELADKSEVTVNVYNTLGELVYTENKGEMAPGKQLVAISTENFANGMYMVELVAGDTKTVTRMNVSH